MDRIKIDILAMEAKPVMNFQEEFENFIADVNSMENVPLLEYFLKRAADLSFDQNLKQKGICLLSDSHGLNLRKQLFYEQGILRWFKNEIDSELNSQYMEFSNRRRYEEKYGKLLDRLRQLPEEWTIVQLSLPFFDATRTWTVKESEQLLRRSKLHVVRYSCGPDLREPYHVKTKAVRGTSDNTRSVFDILYSAAISHPKGADDTREKRVECSNKIKAAVQEVSSGWLRHWCCLLLGRLCDKQLEAEVRIATDRIVKEYAEVIGTPDSDNYQLLYQIINGSAYLTKTYIKNAVMEVILDEKCSDEIARKIVLLKKEELKGLSSAMRYPVILILDEYLQFIPWEMTTVLRNHPVCRMSSIHLIYALYKGHEKSIVGGNKSITNEDLGYYIVNPDGSLPLTQERVIRLIKRRFPRWKGLAGVAPTPGEFSHALENNNFLIYCGHGNGTQYLRSDMIGSLNVRALPFLFGCSSLIPIDSSSGRFSFSGIYDKYMLAGCPCVVGTIWSVTSHDTDLLTVSLLNNWFSGKKVKLKAVQDFHEPELLRAILKARDDAKLYLNKAALVVYGIPVTLKGSKA